MELESYLDEHIDPRLRTQLIRQAPELVVWMIGDPGAPRYGTSDSDIVRTMLAEATVNDIKTK